MKREYVEWIISVVVGLLIGIGAAAIFGGVGWLVALGVVGVVLLYGKCAADQDNKKAAEAQRKLCAERTETYDLMVDHGITVNYANKSWKKGCRIDPETGAMIEPGV